MVSGQTYGGLPGIGALTETTESVIWWGRQERLLDASNYLIGSAAVDSGNSTTTDLRPGLVLGKKTSDGKLYQWSPTATDGTQEVFGVLLRGLSTLDDQNSAADKLGFVLLSGPVKAADLVVSDATDGEDVFTANPHQYLARRQMTQGGRFYFDDDLNNSSQGVVGTAREVAKAADYSVVAADCGTLFTNEGATAAVTFTLPAIASSAGLVYEFQAIADQNVLVEANGAELNIVCFNDVNAAKVSLETAGQIIGGRLRVEANAAGDAWYATSQGPHTVTATASH